MSTYRFLEETREDGVAWHLDMATRWLDAGDQDRLPSPLVYGAFEAQRALECYAYAFVECLWGGELDEAQRAKATTPPGLFDLVEDVSRYYESAYTFTELLVETTLNASAIPKIDPAELRLQWQALEAVVRAPDEERDLDDGYALVQETIEGLREFSLERVLSILEPETLPEELRTIFDRYVRKEIDENDVRRDIRIVEPALRARAAEIDALLNSP